MKERTRLSSGNMLLLELLFAIIVFSLTLSVTLSVFGEAYALSRQAEGRDMAVAESNDVAEIIRSAEYYSEIDGLLALKGLSKNADGYYETSYGDGKYDMRLTTSLSGKLYTAEIACYDLRSTDGTPIYELKIQHALKKGDGRESAPAEENDGR